MSVLNNPGRRNKKFNNYNPKRVRKSIPKLKGPGQKKQLSPEKMTGSLLSHINNRRRKSSLGIGSTGRALKNLKNGKKAQLPKNYPITGHIQRGCIQLTSIKEQAEKSKFSAIRKIEAEKKLRQNFF